MPFFSGLRLGDWFRPGLMALLYLALFFGGAKLSADPALPPKPTAYFTDNAGVVDYGAGLAINRQLEDFERQTSNQVLVAIYTALPPDAEVAQYATATFNAWGVGQKGPNLGSQGGNNGVVLFVFVNDHKMFIATGRGLEGALPDAICKRIITEEIAPAFKQGDYTGGVRHGVAAILAATQGEYKGNGRTHADRQGIPVWLIIVIIIAFILLQIFVFPNFSSGPVIFTSGGFGGGYGGGGGDFGGGGGGFSGGGGDSAGGGAGGSW